MTTLTKILINSQLRQGRKLLTNPHAMHAAVSAAFQPDIETDEARLLLRIDRNRHENVLYIVGPEKPTAAGIVEQAGYDTRPGQSLYYTLLLISLL